jgi:hypothetical protein
LDIVVLHVSDIIEVVHERHIYLAGGGTVERLGGGLGFVIRFGPNSLEVNGVRQDQPGKASETAGRQDVLDFVLGLLRHPTVDLAPGRLRSGLEVCLVDVGLIFGFGDFQKGRQERMAFLGPQRIGDAQLDARLLAGVAELALEFAKGGMELSLILAEVEDLAHLLLGLATCAGVGHSQGGRDAVGGEEEVTRGRLELVVELQGKRCAALNERLGLSRSGSGRRAEDG